MPSFTGTTIDLSDFNLPDEDDFTDDQMNEKLQLQRNGVRQRYDTDLTSFYNYKSSESSQDITLDLAAVASDWFIVKFE